MPRPAGFHDDAGVPRTVDSIRVRPNLAPRGIAIGWIAAALLWPGVIVADPVGSARFFIDADLRSVASSVDGRYAIDASARLTPEARSNDGRYALTAVNAPSGGCASNPVDAVFVDGFEGP